MKVAFVQMPTPGHVNPTLPVIGELRKRGHEVVAFASRAMAPRLERAGATATSYEEHFSHDVNRPPESLIVTGEALLETTRAATGPLAAALGDEAPDVVVSDSMAPWGRLAARAIGAPVVCSTATFAIHRRVGGLRGALRLAGDLAANASSARRCRRLRREIAERFEDPGDLLELFANRAGAATTLVYTSRELQPGARHLGEAVLFVGPPVPTPEAVEALDPELTSLAEAGPLVYVSLGTLFNERPELFRACLEAFAGTEMRCVLSIGDKLDPASLGEVPENAIVRSHVPQFSLLERASLFVTHGGMNSASEALWHGVPMILAPQSADQPIVAARVRELGAGEIASGLGLPSPRRLRDLAERVRRGRYAERARAIGETLRRCGGAVAAADAIESIGAAARPTGGPGG